MLRPLFGAVNTQLSKAEASSSRLQTSCVPWYLVDRQLVYHMEGLSSGLFSRTGSGFMHMSPFSPDFMVKLNFCDASIDCW